MGDFRKVLMKTGLVLVVLGHVSFIAAAVLHGTMLRFVAAASDAVVLQYCVVDILSVTSAILVRLTGRSAGGRDRVSARVPSTNPSSHLPTVQALKHSASVLSSVKWGRWECTQTAEVPSGRLRSSTGGVELRAWHTASVNCCNKFTVWQQGGKEDQLSWGPSRRVSGKWKPLSWVLVDE